MPNARDLVAADPILAVHDHPEGHQPLVEAHAGVREDRAGPERELRSRVLLVAAPAGDARHIGDLAGAALRAGDAARPTHGNQKIMAVLVVLEPDDRVLQRLW